ncbi:Ig domain-containing protein [Streptomyces laculatispora]|uniref:Ig domain-containing protein n=1 Tax=Streptomyces laculatispora TaxID=887464 RepID=UPI001A94F1CD|nr:Ig domain-containing protein [Streptomyces laculatispora]MBO0916525.1 putative Ig domain-containing protein [Streptomyces laculatispora]
MDRRRFLAVSGLSSIAAMATATGGAVGPADAAQRNSQAQPPGSLRITAGFLSLGMNDSGRVTSLVDRRSGTDHLAAGTSVPLVSVVVDGEHEVPTGVRTSPRAPGVFVFSGKKTTIEVKCVRHPTYCTLEVVGLSSAAGADVQTLLWGPLPTTITQTIGQTVGVVRDDAFALGLRPVNDKTVGGWPNEFLSYGFGPDITNNPYGLQTPDDDEWLRSNVAAKTSWGSVLRAYTYDYGTTRVRTRSTGYQIPLGPLPAPEGRIVGSRIALFGCGPDLATTVLSQVAKGQDLPYPTIDGQWQKSAQRTSQSHFWVHDLNTGNVTDASLYAGQAGVKNIYAISGNGPWVSQGHFQFNSSFGGSDAAAAQLVATAAKNGVNVGVHTLSDFIDPSDPYVSAPADPRLATGGSVALTRPVSPSDTTIYVNGSGAFASGVDGKRIRIGDEIIVYGSVTQAGGTEWAVGGLSRAQWGSSAQSHPAGSAVTRLLQNGYGGAIGGLPIIDEVATRLATAYNTTGIEATSYDGLESAGYTGWGGYGFARLVNGVYRQLDSHDGFVTECSNLSSNTWDAQSRASWGEIGPTDYAQILRSNTFYRANYLPGMMGQQALSGDTSLLTIESTLARAASQNAGVNFETSVSSLANGKNTAPVLEAINTWEAARNSGAFTPAQREELRDASKRWHLSVVTRDQKWSLQELDSSGNPVGSPRAVEAPAPGFANPAPVDARVGRQYEFKIDSTTPKTRRYVISRGALPAGLTLNPDTGGITGIPKSAGVSTFTVVAQNNGVADAGITYTVKTTA